MIKFMDKILSFTLSTLMALMVLDVTWQIITRFFTDSPSSWSEEVARFLLIWIGLLGAAWAYRQRAHLGLSYVVEKFGQETQVKIAIFSYLMVGFFAITVMIYGGTQLVMLTLELNQSSASLGLKIGYIYMVIPISGILITLYAIDFMKTALGGEHYVHPHLEEEGE
ncbi:MAG: TRAP transporter small permease [Kordiimonadaceae bacterium]|jgi:TRAP-type C4-dicarboxylate transport system permease small subunit|nr:TRAP transporter small permease [Kordiimonadaceae bacterium]MBT6033001.1 TRAP transporter small permease [Kordiimonadaceae bacterium]